MIYLCSVNKAHYQCQTNHLSRWKHYLRENLHRSMFREFCILSFSSKCSSWWPNKGQVFNETMQRNLTFFEGWPYMSTCKHFRLFHLSWGSLHQMGLVYLASQKGIECINMSMKMDRKTPQSMIFLYKKEVLLMVTNTVVAICAWRTKKVVNCNLCLPVPSSNNLTTLLSSLQSLLGILHYFCCAFIASR